MIGISELDDLISQQLRRCDLVQCALVNKGWHKAVVHHLWGDLTDLNGSLQRDAFSQMIMEDYQQQQQESPPSVSFSTLSKYGLWIKKIPSHNEFLSYLRYQTADNQPAKLELLRHFLRRCTFAMVRCLPLVESDLESVELLQTIAELYLPRTLDLRIETPRGGRPIEYWMLKHLLTRCSSNLESLTLDIALVYTEDKKKGWEGEYKEESEPRWLLKDLKLLRCNVHRERGDFWPWLGSRCRRLKALEVCEIGIGAVNLAREMLEHMQDLTEIHLGWNTKRHGVLQDRDVAALLCSSHKGWKIVKLRSGVNIQSTSKAVLLQLPTLEEMVIDGDTGVDENDVVRILSSCPKLRSLIIIEDGNGSPLDLPAPIFIDQDGDTGRLKAWACEQSLQVIQVHITNIPRPDLDDPWRSLNETYWGQGREIQKRVYERLARFTKLEVLRLGHLFDDADDDGELPGDQYDGLEMTLDSGLHLLAGLKGIRELDVSCLRTGIRVADVEWMSNHWPGLCKIKGLEYYKVNEEAVEWLQKHCPSIRLEF
ncbi:hypothetical protein BGZ65_009500 [Modicella reniformis]|uniref:F-box domain-containing protein n=1 Tax=Modicella reniformis TaxID=1440133 RepID=A0A9P6MBM8_9FUNG|nr:hypothetical protein BGZ65_009500 [Modicella reniformis]